tara:strand:+ start:422 stop:826 length:405 start_codon:yes stop_codon:yes gene_type:complete
MALSTTTLSNPVGTTIYIDADANSTVEVAASTGKTAYQLYINNLGNGNPCFIQLVAATSATSGTTDSTFRFYCPGDSTISYVLPTGLAFANGVCLWATAAGTTVANNISSATTGKAIGDTTSPVNAVELRLHTS